MLRRLYLHLKHLIRAKLYGFRVYDMDSGAFLFNTSPDEYDFVPFTPRSLVQVPTLNGADNAFIREIHWCKEKALPYHEFLVLHVQEKSRRGLEAVILVERCVDKSKIKLEQLGPKVETERAPKYLDEEMGEVDFDSPDFQEQDDTTPSSPARSPQASQSNTSLQRAGRGLASITSFSSSLPSSSSLASISSKSREANDRLVFSQYKYGSDKFISRVENDYDPLYILHISGPRFSVSMLYLLTNIVHKYHPRYKPLAYQCYWFAKTVYSVIKIACTTPGMVNPGVREVPQMYHRRCGKFGILEIPNPNRLSHQGFYDRFYKAWKEVERDITSKKQLAKMRKDQEIDEAVNPERAGRLQAEEAKERERASKERERAGRLQAEEARERERAGRLQAEERIRQLEEALRRQGQSSRRRVI